MRLHGEGPARIKQRRIGAEIVLPDHARALGQLRHLILMPGVQGQGLALEIVFLGADRPAFGIFLDLAAKGLGDDLVTEADADHGHGLGIGLADEVFQRRDEVMRLIGAVARAGQQPAIRVMDRGRKLHPLDMVVAEGEAGFSQQPDEHVRVIACLIFQRFGRLPAL